MEADDILTSSVTLWFFVLFIVHCTTVVFISGIYAFAYRFLGNGFYVPLALGWLANAAYIAIEIVFLMTRAGRDNRVAFGLMTASLGIISIPLFHLALVRHRVRKESSIWYRPPLLGLLMITICFAGGMWAYSGTNFPPSWFFAAFTLPPALYSAWVLISVGHRFSLDFPESDYGISSRVLYVSWGGYGILQFFYPFKFFFGSYPLIFLLLFLTAFFLKVLSSVALLNVLRESYLVVQAESREASVMAEIGNVAAGLHHDIANPLTWIDNELKILEQKRQGDDLVLGSIKRIRRPVQLIDSAIEFVSFIRVDPAAIARNFKRVKAREPLNLAVSLFKKKHPNSSLRIILPNEDAPVYYVRANANLLAEAFLNFFNNALEASARIVRVRIRRITESDPKVEFTFSNDGKFLTDDERNNCFKPGWSSKEEEGVRANVGMGLYMASKIISIHRGVVDIDNEPTTQAVRVVVTVPAAKHIAERGD